MKRSTLIALVFAVISYLAVASPAQAQRLTYTTPIQAWVVDEFPFNDYKLVFVIPNSKRWKLVGSNRTVDAVLSTVQRQKDGVVDYDRGSGLRVITVTAGGRARYGNGYVGSLNMWRNSVRVAWW
jgi:hypothetical protein